MKNSKFTAYDQLSAEQLISTLSPGEVVEYLIYALKESPNDFDIKGIKGSLQKKTDKRKVDSFMKMDGLYNTEGLELLDEMTNEELMVLQEIYLEKGGSITSTINLYDEYEANPGRPEKYPHLIRRELREYGSNTFCLELDSYKEILIKVCKKLDVPFNSKQSIVHIEHNLLEKVLMDSWEKMTQDQRDEVLKAARKSGSMKGAGASVLIGAFNAGGFASYQLALIIANTIAKMILNRGLSLAANAALTKALAIFSGPIGIVLSALWTIVDIAGPAYRVIVPAVIYIAAIRQVHSNEAYKNMTF